MSRILFTNPDTGVVAIVCPAPGFSAKQCMQAVPHEVISEGYWTKVPDLDVNGEPILKQDGTPQLLDVWTPPVIEPTVPYEIVDTSEIPSDRTFRDAWEHDTSEAPEKVSCNVPKAKEIAHGKRRTKRGEDLAPLDIEATIPKLAKEAEKERQKIRNKDEKVQLDIEDCDNESEIKEVLRSYGAL